jgi:hypothetical protein
MSPPTRLANADARSFAAAATDEQIDRTLVAVS